MAVVLDRLAMYVANVSWQNRTVAAIASFVKASLPQPSKVAEVPFNSERRWSAITLSSSETLILGAPELLTEDPTLLQETLRLGEQGFRVVAFATSHHLLESDAAALPPTWRCIALLALQDEIRPDVGDTLKSFAEQGISVKIISGDSPETVKAVARQAGIREESILTGPQVEQMDDEALGVAVQETYLFARIAPDTKRRIVVALSKKGTVAMIGDGVNDVPALKQASVAIAMNDAAQVVKDVSDIILLNNAFSTLPRAIAEGREISQRVYTVAKIYLVKVLYSGLLFILAWYAGLPWPATLLQMTWLGAMTSGTPTVLILFRMLPAPNITNNPRDVIRYCLIGGAIGGVAMVLIDILILVVLKGELALSRTVILVFACLYGSLIFLDVHEVSPFRPRSFVMNTRPAIAGIILGAISVLVPVYVMPSSLGLVSLGWQQWLLLTLILVGASVAVQYSVRKSPLLS